MSHETATLLGFLEYQRATLAWKCAGLDATGLRATVIASTMNPGRAEASGLCRGRLVVPVAARTRPSAPLGHGGLEGRPRLGVALAADDTPEELLTLWQDAGARSRSQVAEALVDGGLEWLARRTWPDGEAPSL